jgi:hypothetical protein
MSILGNKIKKGMDLFTPDPENEHLIFRRFKGEDLIAASNGTPVPSSKIEKVVLKVNPQQVTFSERKNVQKVQTTMPGRFVVFDWGSELVMLSIQGSTGNLLPPIITDGLNTGMLDTAGDIAGLFGQGSAESSIHGLQQAVGPALANFTQNMFIGKMTYYELINLSPKYKTFTQLKKMYSMFDADKDVLTLEMGDSIYRGFFEQFDFSIMADSPWNWKYNINFVIMEDLQEAIKRNDASHSSNNPNIDQS